MASYGHTFTSGDTVTPTKLNAARTVSDIVNADIKSDAAIAGSKIAPSFNAPAVVAVNSSSDALRITQEGSGNALVVEDSTNPDSTPLVVNSVGQIISGATTAFNETAGLQITADSSNAPNASINIRRCSDTTNPTFILTRTRGTGALPTSIQTGDQIGRIQYNAFNGTGLGSAAAIQAHIDGAVSATSLPGRLTFETTPTNSLAVVERMRIDSAGRVGIGTTTPTTALDVNGTVTATAFAGPITGNVIGNLTGTASAIANDSVTDAKVAAAANIADTKLATIATAGKVSNSATTATNANTANAIVARDASGNFSAGTITASLTGNVTGNLTGTASAIANDSVTDAKVAAGANIADTKLATIATAGKVANSATTATNANTASAIVARDASGNFSAGTITASLTGNVTGNLTGTASAIADGTVSTAKIVDGAVTNAKLATATQQSLVPAGAIMPFAMNSAPSGWLAADGAAVSRSTYAALFAAIGTTHGSGDGSTTFNLPDLRGIFVRGSGSQTVSGTTYNKTFAAKEAHATGEHTHAISFGYVAAKPTTSAFTTGGGGTAINGAVAAGANEIANTTATSAGLAAETRPANIALLYCVKF